MYLRCSLLNNRRLHLWAVFLLLLVLLTMSGSRPGAAEAAGEMTDIRVGLAALSAGKASLQIKNTDIALGYCIKDLYQSDAEFSSSSGFTFTPAQECYYILSKTFSKYENAEKTAAVIRKLGVDAWPVAIYRNYWRVYVGGKTKNAMTAVYSAIEGRYGYTYSALQEPNTHRVLVSADGYSFLIDGSKKSAYPQFKALEKDDAGNAVLKLGTRSYRGRIEIGCYGKNSVTAVNIINVEAYLYGVVPCEMQAGYEMEALKAQAVCARSYALMKTGYRADSNINRAYYLEDTTSSQVYRGYTAETARTTKAVQETSGVAVYLGDKMVSTYYFSTSGGSTESIAEVWGMKLDYLQTVPDLQETEPEKAPWMVSLTAGQIAEKLAAFDLGVGTVQTVSAQVYTMSGRIYSMKIKGSRGSTNLQTGTIREVLGLYSTKVKVVEKGDTPDRVVIQGAAASNTAEIHNCYTIQGDGAVTAASDDLNQYIVISADNLTNFPVHAPADSNMWYFYGLGYGHGVGMSQSGANGLAKEGYSYQEIISYYFHGCSCR